MTTDNHASVRTLSDQSGLSHVARANTVNLLPYRIAAGLFIVFMAGFIYLADTRQHLSWLQLIYTVPYADKLGHLLLYGTLAFLVNVAGNAAQLQFGRWRFLTGSLIVMIATVLEECSQLFIRGRSFDWWDLAADAVAILVGGWLAKRLLR